jgi:hypothetical protein
MGSSILHNPPTTHSVRNGIVGGTLQRVCCRWIAGSQPKDPDRSCHMLARLLILPNEDGEKPQKGQRATFGSQEVGTSCGPRLEKAVVLWTFISNEQGPTVELFKPVALQFSSRSGHDVGLNRAQAQYPLLLIHNYPSVFEIWAFHRKGARNRVLDHEGMDGNAHLGSFHSFHSLLSSPKFGELFRWCKRVCEFA